MSTSSSIEVAHVDPVMATLVERPSPPLRERRHRARAEHAAIDATPDRIPFLGEVFAGRYRLLEQLGRRGGGRVYRARDDILARDVAVKIFHVDAPSAGDPPRRLTGARVLAALDHPALVTFYDAHLTSEGHGYLVMEFIPGPPLRQHLDAVGALPAKHAAALLRDVAHGLASIHAVGVVHGHVTSSNILLRPLRNAPRPFAAVLAEFSVGHLLGEETPVDPLDAAAEATEYLPPELVVDAVPRAESDIHALGLLALELLTGERPLKGGAVQELVLTPLSYDPEIPTRFGYGWELLLTAMTDPDPSLRPTASEVADLAAELIDGRAVSDTVSPTLADPPIVQQAVVVAAAASVLAKSATDSRDEDTAAPSSAVSALAKPAPSTPDATAEPAGPTPSAPDADAELAAPVAALRAVDQARETTSRYRGRRAIWAWVTHYR